MMQCMQMVAFVFVERKKTNPTKRFSDGWTGEIVVCRFAAVVNGALAGVTTAFQTPASSSPSVARDFAASAAAPSGSRRNSVNARLPPCSANVLRPPERDNLWVQTVKDKWTSVDVEVIPGGLATEVAVTVIKCRQHQTTEWLNVKRSNEQWLRLI